MKSIESLLRHYYVCTSKYAQGKNEKNNEEMMHEKTRGERKSGNLLQVYNKVDDAKVVSYSNYNSILTRRTEDSIFYILFPKR